MTRLRARWAQWSLRRRIITVVLTIIGAVALWVGIGFLTVLRQVGTYAEYWEQRADEPGDLVYLALGDSAAQGVGASAPELGYVGLIASRLEEATGRSVRVVNISVSGARVADVISEQLPRLGQVEADVVTLAIGGNDAAITDPQEFARDLATVVEALPEGAYVADVPDFQGGPRLAAARELSSIAREVIADHPEVIGVALEESTSDNGWSEYARDFFHPSDSGYVNWAEPFWDEMSQRPPVSGP